MFGNLGATLNCLGSMYSSVVNTQQQIQYAQLQCQQAESQMKMQQLLLKYSNSKPQASIKCNGCGSMEFRTHRGVQVCSYCRVSQR